MIVYERFIIHFTDVIVALLLLMCVHIVSLCNKVFIFLNNESTAYYQTGERIYFHLLMFLSIFLA